MRRVPQVLMLFAGLSFAAPVGATEAGADPDIQTLITAQMDAFDQGDAVRAESFAAPGIKTLFPDAAGFLGMVRQSYAPLIHPRATHFQPTETSPAGTMQHVTIVAADGVVWTAIYALEKIDGRWAISGCVLVKSPESTA
jgi:hypothetical protein